jgi:signal transduction histidine kinase
MTRRKDAPKALVVDDEEGVRLFLEHVLVDLGCEVLTVETAAEASERIRDAEPLDLVLLDKNLPDRSGLDVLAEAKGHDPDLEIVMITGYASLEAAVNALRFGAGDFLTKPFDELQVLRGKLQSAIERARRARERTALIATLQERERDLEAQVGQRTADLEKALANLRRQDVERRRLMANVAHDLRTPLTTIQGYLDMLHRSDLPEARRTRYVQVMNGQCQRLQRLTRDVTFLARQADGHLTWKRNPLETEDLLARAATELAPLFEQADVALEWSVGEGAEHLVGDDDRLMQVLTNLLGNAAKFAPSTTVVRLRAEADEDAILITVSDAGPGVPEADRGTIFERYHTADAAGRGEGLGLSICRDIAEAHGGRVWVDESEDGGALFCLLLPVSASQASGAAASGR